MKVEELKIKDPKVADKLFKILEELDRVNYKKIDRLIESI